VRAYLPACPAARLPVCRLASCVCGPYVRVRHPISGSVHVHKSLSVRVVLQQLFFGPLYVFICEYLCDRVCQPLSVRVRVSCFSAFESA